MSTSLASRDVVAATRPWALFALGQHVADHQLPFEEADVRDRAVVWVLAQHTHAWRTTSVREIDHTAHRHPAITDAWKHEANLILDGSCVQVTLRWFTYVDHDDCDVCGTGLCGCLDLDQVCAGRVAHACSHGRNLCPDHQGDCTECADDLRQDRAEGWAVR